MTEATVISKDAFIKSFWINIKNDNLDNTLHVSIIVNDEVTQLLLTKITEIQNINQNHNLFHLVEGIEKQRTIMSRVITEQINKIDRLEKAFFELQKYKAALKIAVQQREDSIWRRFERYGEYKTSRHLSDQMDKEIRMVLDEKNVL